MKDKIAALLDSLEAGGFDNDYYNDVVTSDYRILLRKSHELVVEICSHLSKSYLSQVSLLSHLIILP